VDGYFPFTYPSFEMEIFFNKEWMEVLGCGVVHHTIMKNCGLAKDTAWAFGIGLERMAMLLFEIPDIRLFWSPDKRFHSQFKRDKVVKFKPYSKYPICKKDISFWVSPSFHLNNFCEMLRGIGGDLVENVKESFLYYTLKRANSVIITF